jgi:hypothetical protein
MILVRTRTRKLTCPPLMEIEIKGWKGVIRYSGLKLRLLY